MTRLATLTLVAACGCAAPVPQEVAPAIVFRIDLDRSGVDFPVYRIPALAVSNAGTLIAAYDGRPSMADVPGPIALLVRRSTDEGRTWLPRQAVRAGPAPAGFGDPSLLVDRVTGRIFLFHVASMRQGFSGSATGTDETDPDVLQADLSWSDDDGVTWAHRRITAAIKDPAWGGIFAASGQGIQLVEGTHAGRLLQQYVIRHDGKNFGASAYSDDHGVTWQMGALAGPGVDENKTVELSDGRVMLNSRATPHRLIAWSEDGGLHYSGLRPDSQLVDPGNNGAIIRTAPRRLAISHTAHPNERRNLVVQLSCNDGQTWSPGGVVESGAAGYSTLVTLPGGDIGVLYERGTYEAITFARFTPVWPDGCS